MPYIVYGAQIKYDERKKTNGVSCMRLNVLLYSNAIGLIYVCGGVMDGKVIHTYENQ